MQKGGRRGQSSVGSQLPCRRQTGGAGPLATCTCGVIPEAPLIQVTPGSRALSGWARSAGGRICRAPGPCKIPTRAKATEARGEAPGTCGGTAQDAGHSHARSLILQGKRTAELHHRTLQFGVALGQLGTGKLRPKCKAGHPPSPRWGPSQDSPSSPSLCLKVRWAKSQVPLISDVLPKHVRNEGEPASRGLWQARVHSSSRAGSQVSHVPFSVYTFWCRLLLRPLGSLGYVPRDEES